MLRGWFTLDKLSPWRLWCRFHSMWRFQPPSKSKNQFSTNNQKNTSKTADLKWRSLSLYIKPNSRSMRSSVQFQCSQKYQYKFLGKPKLLLSQLWKLWSSGKIIISLLLREWITQLKNTWIWRKLFK